MTVSAGQQIAQPPAVYTCPMHPHVREAAPGSCSICGMALVPAGAGAGIFRPLAMGTLASLTMLGVYFGVLTLVSGWDFTASEFARFWYFVVALAFGFGTQIGLYVYLKQVLALHHAAGTMVVASGTTSTAAMLACCAHYLANVLPIVGAAGLVTLVAQYQVELFWVGLAFNAAGIAFVGNRILQARRHA
jgi:Cu+-exporting ATPase